MNTTSGAPVVGNRAVGQQPHEGGVRCRGPQVVAVVAQNGLADENAHQLLELIARHTRSAVNGMSRWRHAQVRQRIDDRVLHRRRGADGARLADALRAERIARRRRLHRVTLERRQLGGRDDCRSPRVGRERIAELVVAHLFEQRLRDALGEAAMNLAIGEQRIDDDAAVVDGDESLHRDVAGVSVDFDHSDVRAEGERCTARFEIELFDQRFVLRARDLGPADAFRGSTDYVEASTVEIEHDIVDIRFELVCGQLASVLDEQIGRTGDGRATDLQRT
jgi:hypothetical protein